MLNHSKEYDRKTNRVLVLIVLIIIIAVYALLTIMLGEVKASSCLPHNRETVELVSIVDGDTIKVRHQNGAVNSVRYIGVDTPERGEPLFSSASAKNAELLDNTNITLVRDISNVDPYGRLLRYVLADGKDVGADLLTSGYAQVMTIQPDVSCSQYYLEIR
jgi:micrococcal nuclease